MTVPVTCDLLLDGMRVGVLDALDAIGDTGASGALEDILTRLAEDIGADL